MWAAASYPPPPDAAAVAGPAERREQPPRALPSGRRRVPPPPRVRCRGRWPASPALEEVRAQDPAWAALAWPPVGPGPASHPVEPPCRRSGQPSPRPLPQPQRPPPSLPAAGGPPGLPPCSTPISRTRPCPSTWRARSCSARRVPSQARVRGPYLPLHSSIRGRAGQTRRDLTRPLEARSSQRLHRVLISVVLSSALSLVGRAARVEQLDQRSGVRDAGEPQRPPEGATPLCQREAVRIGVQMCPPPR